MGKTKRQRKAELRERIARKQELYQRIPEDLEILFKYNENIYSVNSKGNGVKLNKDYLASIISFVYTRSYDVKEWKVEHDPIFLYSPILMEKYGNDYRTHFNYLIKHGFLKIAVKYQKGVNSNGYVIPKNVYEGNWVDYINRNKKLLDNYKDGILNGYSKAVNSVIKKRVRNYVNDCVGFIEIDYEGAIGYLGAIGMEKHKYDRNVYMINTINQNNKDHLWIRFDDYGRVHTNFTVLKSEIRKSFLRIEGEKTKEMDIPNSQPLLLALLIQRNKKKYGLCKYEFEHFKHLVISGKLYSFIIKNTNIDSKKKVKKFFFTVLFGNNEKNNKENKIFKKLFPTIHNFMYQFKQEKRSNSILATALQRAESELIFNNIIKEMIDIEPNLIFFTVHDSIVVKESKYESCIEIFNKHIHNVYKELA